MITGIVVNNTGKAKHIFKRSVYPGQEVELEYVYSVLGSKVPEGETFLNWLQDYVPAGWEVHGEEKLDTEKSVSVAGDGLNYVEKESTEDDTAPSLQYLTPKKINNMSASDIANLRVKDDPRKIIKQIDSIHKLRRALTLCNKLAGKATLGKIIKARIDRLR